MTDILDPLVILTAVLAAVTAFYAYTTILLVRETRASRETQQEQYKLDNEPRLGVGTKWYGVNLFTYLVNVGRTPALNVAVIVSVKLKDGSSLSLIEPGKVVSKLLMPGEKEHFDIPDCRFDIIKRDFHSIVMSGTCKDIHGKVHPVEEEWVFEIPDAATASQRNITQFLPDDDPLIQVKKAILDKGGDLNRSLGEIGDKIDRIGPITRTYCPKCQKFHRIDVRELDLRCEECGSELGLL